MIKKRLELSTGTRSVTVYGHKEKLRPSSVNISTSLYDQRSFPAMSIPIQSADKRLSNRIIIILICFLQWLTWSDHLRIYLNAGPHNDHITLLGISSNIDFECRGCVILLLSPPGDHKTWCRFEFPSVIVSRNSYSHRFTRNYLEVLSELRWRIMVGWS